MDRSRRAMEEDAVLGALGSEVAPDPEGRLRMARQALGRRDPYVRTSLVQYQRAWDTPTAVAMVEFALRHTWGPGYLWANPTLRAYLLPAMAHALPGALARAARAQDEGEYATDALGVDAEPEVEPDPASVGPAGIVRQIGHAVEGLLRRGQQVPWEELDPVWQPAARAVSAGLPGVGAYPAQLVQRHAVLRRLSTGRAADVWQAELVRQLDAWEIAGGGSTLDRRGGDAAHSPLLTPAMWQRLITHSSDPGGLTRGLLSRPRQPAEQWGPVWASLRPEDLVGGFLLEGSERQLPAVMPYLRADQMAALLAGSRRATRLALLAHLGPQGPRARRARMG